MESQKSGEKHRELSRREYQVAELIAWGAAKKEIPEMLQKLYGGIEISVRTVENICRGIYEKLHIGKTNELSAWWFCRHYGVDEDLSPMQAALQHNLFNPLPDHNDSADMQSRSGSPPITHKNRTHRARTTQKKTDVMEISLKHLKMIRIAIESHIDILEDEYMPVIPIEEHQAEISAYVDLLEQIDFVLLKQ